MPITVVSSFLGDFTNTIVQTDYNFVILNVGGATYGKLPPNVRVTKYLTPDIKPDVVLCYNQNHVNVYQMISSSKKIPLVIYRTEYPKSIHDVFQQINGNYCIYNNLFCATAWQDTDGSRAAVIAPGAKVTGINKKPQIKIFNDTVTQELLNWMGAGNIVVAKTSPEINALIRDGQNGFLYNNNHAKIIGKIQELLDEQSLISIGNSAQKTIGEFYNIDKCVTHWGKILEKIVNANSYNHRR